MYREIFCHESSEDFIEEHKFSIFLLIFIDEKLINDKNSFRV